MENEKDLNVNGENTAAENQSAPKRKPVIRKVSAAPTKFAPKQPKEAPEKPKIVNLVSFDDDFSDEDDAAAYAGA